MELPRAELLAVSEPCTELSCSICLDAFMHDATTLNPCGHTICERCSRRVCAPKSCPICRKGVVNTLPNYTVRNIVGRVQLRCGHSLQRVTSQGNSKRKLSDEWEERPPSISCTAIIRFDQWDLHTRDCEFALVDCPKKEFGCDEVLIKRDLQQHMQSGCRFQTRLCRDCGVEVLEEQLENHHASCLFKFISCPRATQGCNHTCLRRDMRKHLTTCTVELLTTQLETAIAQQAMINMEIERLRNRLDEETRGFNIFVKLPSGKSKNYLVKKTCTCKSLLGEVGLSNLPCTVQYEGKVLLHDARLCQEIRSPDSTIHVVMKHYPKDIRDRDATTENTQHEGRGEEEGDAAVDEEDPTEGDWVDHTNSDPDEWMTPLDQEQAVAEDEEEEGEDEEVGEEDVEGYARDYALATVRSLEERYRRSRRRRR